MTLNKSFKLSTVILSQDKLLIEHVHRCTRVENQSRKKVRIFLSMFLEGVTWGWWRCPLFSLNFLFEGVGGGGRGGGVVLRQTVYLLFV